MKLQEYVQIMYQDTHIKVMDDHKNCLAEGILKDIDISKYLDEEVKLASGSADNQGVVLII